MFAVGHLGLEMGARCLYFDSQSPILDSIRITGYFCLQRDTLKRDVVYPVTAWTQAVCPLLYSHDIWLARQEFVLVQQHSLYHFLTDRVLVTFALEMAPPVFPKSEVLCQKARWSLRAKKPLKWLSISPCFISGLNQTRASVGAHGG